MEIETYIQGDFNRVKGFVCIPALGENGVLETIESLKLTSNFGLCIHFNCDEHNSAAKQINIQSYELVKTWAKANSFLPIYLILNNSLTPATVGNARKCIMDIAANLANNKDVFIACLDADCTVSSNYLETITHFFKENTTLQAASVNFWHTNESCDFNTPIIMYESHLRYLKLGLQFAGFPFYYHTVGSSMVCKVGGYLKTGGMNTKAAGEDFYFLQKLMPLGFGEIWDTCVYPSSRISHRVPFGTGKAMEKAKNGELEKDWYAFSVFEELKKLFTSLNVQLGKPLEAAWEVKVENEVIMAFISNKKWEQTWKLISKNSKNTISRNKKWLEFLSGNMVFLLCNQLRNTNANLVSPIKEIELLFGAFNYTPNNSSIRENLLLLEKQKSISFLPL